MQTPNLRQSRVRWSWSWSESERSAGLCVPRRVREPITKWEDSPHNLLLNRGAAPSSACPAASSYDIQPGQKWCVTSPNAHMHAHGDERAHTLGNFYIVFCIPFRWWRASVRLGRSETKRGGGQITDRLLHKLFLFSESMGKYYTV